MASSPMPAPAPGEPQPSGPSEQAAAPAVPQPSTNSHQQSSDGAAPGTPRQASPEAAGPTSPPAAAAPPSGPRSRRVAGPSATGKVSNKKKEALAQVPCKFFRSSNGCSAGSDCAFAHTQGGAGSGAGGAGGRGKEDLAVCQWFLKGNCRFGHKCALAHILPGQPPSMDRKNKRAQQLAQQEQAGMGGGAGGRDGAGKQRAERRNGGDEAQRRGPGMAGMHGQPNGSGHVGDGYDSLLAQPPMRSANAGPPPGMPRPLVPANLPLSHDPAVLFSTDSNGAIHLDGSGPSAGVPLHFGAGGRQPPHLMQHAPGGLSMQQPIASSSAFGTSPFNSGSHSVFFSGSHEQGGAGPFASSAGRSYGDGSNGFSRWRGDADGRVTDDEEDAEESEEEGDLLINKEDFLPSSLSDLLTPAELSRRRRTQAGFLHAPGQSLPQGMAAGLSRLHALPPPSSAQEPSAGYAGYSFDSNSEQQHFVAPSSVLAQRANPLSLAMSMGRSVSNASLDAHHHQSSYGLSASPGPGMAFRGGSSPLPAEGNGIAINRATAGVPQHPGMHRLRTDTVRQQPSPIALPTMGEEVDDGLFELE